MRAARASDGEMRMSARAARKGEGRCPSESTDGAIRTRQSVSALVTVRHPLHHHVRPRTPHTMTCHHRDVEAEPARERHSDAPSSRTRSTSCSPSARCAPSARSAASPSCPARRPSSSNAGAKAALSARWQAQVVWWGVKGLARVLCGSRATCESVLVRSWASQALGVVRVGRKWTATREGPLRPTRPSGAIDKRFPPSSDSRSLGRHTLERKKKERRALCATAGQSWRPGESRGRRGAQTAREKRKTELPKREETRERERTCTREGTKLRARRGERERTFFWGGSRLGAGTRRRGGHERRDAASDRLLLASVEPVLDLLYARPMCQHEAHADSVKEERRGAHNVGERDHADLQTRGGEHSQQRALVQDEPRRGGNPRRTVCQMPSPMRGVTPRYRPLMPFSR